MAPKTPTASQAAADTEEQARKGNFTSVKDVIKHIETIGKQRLTKLNTSATAVQSAGQKGVFRIKTASKTLAETYVTSLSEIRGALATELEASYGRALRAIERVPEGPLGTATFLSETRSAMLRLRDAEEQGALKRRGKLAAARRKAAAKARAAGGGAESEDSATAAVSAAAAAQEAEEAAIAEAGTRLDSLEEARDLADAQCARRQAEIDAASLALVSGYSTAKLRAIIIATALAPAVAGAIDRMRTAQAVELGGLLETVRAAVLRVRAEVTGARRAFLQQAGASVLGGVPFEAAVKAEVEEWQEWREKRSEARDKADVAKRAKADAEASAAGASASGPGTAPRKASSSSGKRRTSSSAESLPSGSGSSGVSEGEDEEEAVLLGTCGTGGSVILGADGRPLGSEQAAARDDRPAFLKTLKSKVAGTGARDKRLSWFSSDLDVDLALGTQAAVREAAGEGEDEAFAGADAAAGRESKAEDGEADGEGSAAEAARARAMAARTPAKPSKDAEELAHAAARRSEMDALARAEAAATGGGVFPSLFSVTAYARAVARKRAAQLSASQSSVRALFSRFKGRMSAQASVLGEEAAKATASIATVQDAELQDTLEVVRTCVALLGGFRLSHAGFLERVNGVLGLPPPGEGEAGGGGLVELADGSPAERAITAPAQVIDLAEHRAGARFTFLVDKQRLLVARWRRYCRRVNERVVGCARAVADLALQRMPGAAAADLDDVADSAVRALLALPRTAVALRGAVRPARAGDGDGDATGEDTAPAGSPGLRAAKRAEARGGWTGKVPEAVLSEALGDEAALPAAFARELVALARARLEGAEAEALEQRAHICRVRREHRARYTGEALPEDAGGEELDAVASVPADAAQEAAAAVLELLRGDALASADAADAAAEEASAGLAAAEAEAAAAREEQGAASEAAREAAGAEADAKEALRRAQSASAKAWSQVGVSSAAVLAALDVGAAARRRHLVAMASKLQAWVRAWRAQRSVASVAMAGLVADTIAEFQRALDRELGILTHRAKLAVGRVEKKKGEQWFLDALNERLREMNGAGVAESIAASASGATAAAAAEAAAPTEPARATPKRRL